MKKLLILLLLVGLLFGACSQTEETQIESESKDDHDDGKHKDHDEKVEISGDNDEINIETDDVSVTINEDEVTIETENGTTSIDVSEIDNGEVEEKTVVVEEDGVTVTTTQNSDGSITSETVLDSEELDIPQVDLGDAPPIDEWCIPGETYSGETSEGSATGTIIGADNFEGNEYCKAEAVTEVQGLEVESTYYFNYGGTEIWLVTNVFGQEVKQKISVE